MKRIFLSAILILILVGTGRAQGAADAVTAAPTVETARALAGKGHLDQALVQLDALAKQTPEPAGVERLRGLIFYQREQFDEAVSAFTRAEAQDAKDRESIEMHGVSLFRMGHVKEAIPFLERARTAVDNVNVDPNYVLALCYSDVERYDDARRAFAAQFGFAPESAEAHLLAARQFLRRELKEQAGVEAAKALALRPRLPLAHELLGEVALARGDVATAIRELETERELNPLNPDVYDRLGDAYVRSAQWTKAQEALNRAVLLEPNATGPFILLGQTFLNMNQPIQALHYLDHAVKMDPSNYITHNLLGQAYKAIGQPATANREFKTAVDLQHGKAPMPAEK
ncbi:MAG: tetratricopeptide repeat protein [Terracidiphilus sp.]|nr:tetratricopeptide repeat protein [Terracidiphilus sp.]